MSKKNITDIFQVTFLHWLVKEKITSKYDESKTIPFVKILLVDTNI